VKGGQGLAVRRKLDQRNLIFVAEEVALLSPRARIPELGGTVRNQGGHYPAVGRKGGEMDRAFPGPGQGGAFLAGRRLPELDRAILAWGGQQGAARAKSQRVHKPFVSLEENGLAVPGQGPELDLAILEGQGQEFAGGVQGQAGGPGGRLLEGGPFLA